jgi:hypothetical protein
MTDITEWSYYHKLDTDGTLTSSNLLYVPKINPEQNVMCMHYCTDRAYRNDGDIINEELLQWFFEREVKFLNKLSTLKTSPAVYDVDLANRKVFIEWNKETLSQIVFDKTRNLDEELPDWQIQLKDFLISTKENEFYKMALYPHCFYISKDKVLKTIDYYSVVPYEERFIERKVIEGIIGKDGAYRFDESTDAAGYIDFKKFFEITVTRHLSMYWPNTVFADIFKEIYNNE